MSNINEEYIEDYIRSILPENQAYLRNLEIYADNNHIPIVEKEVAQFLKLLLKIHQPKNILEIGTAIGYSALIMAEANEYARITTIERSSNMVELAKENINNTTYKDRINIIEGEAEEILSNLEGKYDFIFLDAAKGQYLEFFNLCMELLETGGLIVSDNVLFRGMVASDKLVVRRKKTIVKRLRNYLKYINEIDGYISAIIPIGDGIALSYREE
ncbi:MAG: O-methyltransferase [Tissierellia bacterium]|nr:O-methyltransferase [Tissierellia bacterium]